PTPREHLPELLSVLSNVGFVGSNVRDRQQRYELAKNLLLMLGNVSLNRGPRLCSTRNARHSQKQKPSYRFSHMTDCGEDLGTHPEFLYFRIRGASPKYQFQNLSQAPL